MVPMRIEPGSGGNGRTESGGFDPPAKTFVHSGLTVRVMPGMPVDWAGASGAPPLAVNHELRRFPSAPRCVQCDWNNARKV